MANLPEDIKNLAVMAHDLKAPLSAVVNLLTIIEKGYVDDPNKVRDLISRARKKTETLIKIVDDIFNYTLLENKAEMKFEKLDIFTIIEESVYTIKPYAAARNITLHYDRCCKEKFVNGSFTFLFRAFNNVIMNAVKYNKENGRIDIRCSDDNRQTVAIEVADTGEGIPKEDMDNVFEIFSRGPEARKNIESGLGLGLALVKQIIDNHNGSIIVSSDPGIGTTVTIKLPVHVVGDQNV